MNIAIQISHEYTTPVNPVLRYYEKQYTKIDGYYIPSRHYLEVPKWVAEISGRVRVDQLVVITSRQDIAALVSRNDIDAVYGSVLDVTLPVWLDILQALPDSIPVILGGYVDAAVFKQYSNVAWCNTIDELGEGKIDYHLFAGVECIPRLQLSRGCFYDCKFCTIEKGVRELELNRIDEQIEAMQVLSFKLVYIDDKTFGQARNYTFLGPIFDKIKAYNPSFEGFIVQSAVPEITAGAAYWYDRLHVKVIECGIETRDAETLQAWNKSHAINETVTPVIRSLGVHFIPNIIFGIADHDYTNTLQWCRENADIISWFNPYLLCEYTSDNNGADIDENDINKSWLTSEDKTRAMQAFNTLIR